MLTRRRRKGQLGDNLVDLAREPSHCPARFRSIPTVPRYSRIIIILLQNSIIIILFCIVFRISVIYHIYHSNIYYMLPTIRQ